MNEILSLIILALALSVGLVAFFAVLEMFFSQRVAKTLKIVQEMPRRAFWVGLVNVIFFTALALGFFALARRFGERPLVFLIGMIILAAPAAGVIFGMSSLVQYAGGRLAPEKSGLWRTAWGTVGLGFASALPFVGWFGLLPFLVVLSLGAFITGLFFKEKQPVMTETDA